MVKQNIDLDFTDNCFYKLISIDNTEYYDYIFNNKKAYKIPVGETFLTIIESTSLLNEIVSNKGISANESIEMFFKDRLINFSNLYKKFSHLHRNAQIKQFDGILKINDYIAQCCNNKLICNVTTLNRLIINNSEFNNLELLHKLFIINSDSDKTIEFDNLLDLAIISLYTIVNKDFNFYRCSYCNGYFIAHTSYKNKKTCDRKLVINNYNGCNTARILADKANRNSKNYMKQYRRVYARLAKRAAKGNEKDIEVSNKFREEWKALWRDTKHFDETIKEEILLTFINSDEFN